MGELTVSLLATLVGALVGVAVAVICAREVEKPNRLVISNVA
jgi:ABC-type proline/glycine betaine transport system permease subunit